MDLWDSWIAMGLISAAAWGLSCVIDVCFVGEGIYREPAEGPLIAGLFCVMPLVALENQGTMFDVDPGVAAVALLAGICYLLHIYFYFKALFALNDSSNAEIFNTLSVLVVPVLAFILLGEILDPLHYVAIGLSICGILVLVRFQLSTMTWKVVVLLGTSVLFISLVMVMQAWVLQFVAYGAAVSLFSLAAFVTVVCVIAVRMRLRRRVLDLCRRFGLLLIGVQLLELGAVLGSQRATDVGPSVSLVALLECSLPVFVMAFSWMLLGVSRHWRATDTARIRVALATQNTAYPVKLVSIVLIVGAIGLVQW